MIITLDNLASRYNVLPSEALGRASSFDLYVLNVSTQWHNYKNQEAETQANGGKPPTPKLTQEQMKAMIQQVRNRENK
jgi:hypothetical protein